MSAYPFEPKASDDTLRAQLSDRRRQLQQEIREALADVTASNPREMAGAVYDLKDESLAQMLRDVRLFDMHRDIQELLDIDHAFERLSAGSYGICTDCGARIPLARLQVYPTAKRCRPCQEIHERQQVSAPSTARSGQTRRA